MSQLEWDGRHLGGDSLALTIQTAVSTADDAPKLILAVASTGDQRCIIRLERIGEFLLEHRQSLITCYDAATLHWTLEPHVSSAGDWDAWKVLWEFSRDSRLFDVRLFDQLIYLGGYGGDPPPRELAELALFYDVITPDRAGKIGRYPNEFSAGITGPIDDQFLDQVIQTADLIHGIFRKQKEEADKTVALLGIDPSTVRRFGTMTVGVQVQGAIALSRATCNGLRISEDLIPKLHRLCSSVHRESSRLLDRHPAARECFRWADGLIELGKSGLPKADGQKLRRWLERTIASNPSLYNIPLEPPRTPDGEISSIPDHWGHLALIRPELRAWSRLWTAAVLEKALRGRDRHGRVHPRYEVVPSIRSIGPNLDQLRRLEPPPVFAAPAGQTLLVCRFPNLALRCLAEDFERRGEKSRLGSILWMGYDPVRYAAWRLSSPEPEVSSEDEWAIGPGGDEASDPVELWRKLCKKLGRTPDPAAVRLPDPIESWLEFEEGGGEPKGFDRWVALAHALLDGVPRGLGPEHVRVVLDDNNIEFDLGRVERHYRYMVDHVFPELGWFVEDATLEILQRKLGSDPDELQSLMLDGGPDWTAAALRNLIGGKTRVPAVLARLRDINRNEHLEEWLEAGEGSLDLYKALFGEPVAIATGRVRGGTYFTEARASAFLDLADDVLKWVMYRVVAATFDLVACVGEEFVLQVDDNLLMEETIRRVEAMASEAAGEILVRFPPQCAATLHQIWLGSHPGPSRAVSG